MLKFLLSLSGRALKLARVLTWILHCFLYCQLALFKNKIKEEPLLLLIIMFFFNCSRRASVVLLLWCFSLFKVRSNLKQVHLCGKKVVSALIEEKEKRCRFLSVLWANMFSRQYYPVIYMMLTYIRSLSFFPLISLAFFHCLTLALSANTHTHT